MSLQFKSLYGVLCLVTLAEPAMAGGLQSGVRPSDCQPRDADSTCATAVSGAPPAGPPAAAVDTVLYDGPLGGAAMYSSAYWGYDFYADATGTPSIVRPDEFVNRSKVPVTITLTFDIPTSAPCGKNCQPGVQFVVGPGWSRNGPGLVTAGGKSSVSETFAPRQGYGWVIALWQSSNARLTVTVPKGATTTLEDVGMPSYPNDVTAIPPAVASCSCWDGSVAACSDGSRLANGLLGPWTVKSGYYLRPGAFNGCPAER